MNYYEVEHPYYALIAARDTEEAIRIYEEEITGDKDGVIEDSITVITELDAFTKFITTPSTDEDDIKTVGNAIDMFYNAHSILLVDSSIA